MGRPLSSPHRAGPRARPFDASPLGLSARSVFRKFFDRRVCVYLGSERCACATRGRGLFLSSLRPAKETRRELRGACGVYRASSRALPEARRDETSSRRASQMWREGASGHARLPCCVCAAHGAHDSAREAFFSEEKAHDCEVSRRRREREERRAPAVCSPPPEKPTCVRRERRDTDSPPPVCAAQSARQKAARTAHILPNGRGGEEEALLSTSSTFLVQKPPLSTSRGHSCVHITKPRAHVPCGIRGM